MGEYNTLVVVVLAVVFAVGAVIIGAYYYIMNQLKQGLKREAIAQLEAMLQLEDMLREFERREKIKREREF